MVSGQGFASILAVVHGKLWKALCLPWPNFCWGAVVVEWDTKAHPQVSDADLNARLDAAVRNAPDQYIFGRDIPNTEPWGACVMDLESVQELLAARHPDTYVPPSSHLEPPSSKAAIFQYYFYLLSKQ